MNRKVYHLVPVGIALHVYRERLFTEFQVYLLLKSWVGGHCQLTPMLMARLAAHLKNSTRTIARAVSRLRKMNWLGYCPGNGRTYVRGLDTLRIIEAVPVRLAVWFDIDKVQNVEAFTLAVAFGSFVRAQKVRVWRERLGAGQKGTAHQPKRPTALPSFYPVALSLIEKECKVSRSTVSRGRKAAMLAGFLAVQKGKPEHLNIKTPEGYLTGFPEMRGRLFCQGGKWYVRATDKVQTFITYKRRRPLKQRFPRALVDNVLR